MLGDIGVGKTALMTRWTDDKFHLDMVSTAGVDYKSRAMNAEGKCVQVQVWDTAGQVFIKICPTTVCPHVHPFVVVGLSVNLSISLPTVRLFVFHRDMYSEVHQPPFCVDSTSMFTP